MNKTVITHHKCVGLAATWLANRKEANTPYRCKVILREMVGYQSFLIDAEFPDVLGVWGNKDTVNIECKISRSDFLSDKNKKHDHPFGHYKFYACPYGLIGPEELPEGFGLIYVNGRGGKLIKDAIYFDDAQDVVPMLADLIINGCNAGVLNDTHKKRPGGMWDGKAVII